MRYYRRRRRNYRKRNRNNFMIFVINHIINLFTNPKKRASAISFLIRWATAIFLFKDIPLTPINDLNNPLFKLFGGFVLMRIISWVLTGVITKDSKEEGTITYFIIWMILLIFLWLITNIN